MQWSQALKPCLLAAVVAVLLTFLGLNPFVAMFSVGSLAVIFYRQGRREANIRAKTGAALGSLGGLLWFAITAILETPVLLVTHKGGELRAELLARVQQAASQTTDPQALAIFERFKTPDGLQILMLIGIISALLAAIVLGGLGGTVAGMIFKRRRP